MWHLGKLVTAAVVLSLGAAQAAAQQPRGWVGQRVITGPGTVLKVGRQVVADDPGDVTSRVREHSAWQDRPSPEEAHARLALYQAKKPYRAEFAAK